MKKLRLLGYTIFILIVVVVVGYLVMVMLVSSAAGSYQTLEVNHVENTSSDGQKTSFSNLSVDQQRVFKRALGEGGYVKIPEDVDHSVWRENDYVTYQNETYQISSQEVYIN